MDDPIDSRITQLLRSGKCLSLDAIRHKLRLPLLDTEQCVRDMIRDGRLRHFGGGKLGLPREPPKWR